MGGLMVGSGGKASEECLVRASTHWPNLSTLLTEGTNSMHHKLEDNTGILHSLVL